MAQKWKLGTCNCLLQRVLPDFASNGDVELLQRFLVLGIREVEIVDIRKLDWSISKEVTLEWSSIFVEWNVARELLWQASVRQVQI